MNLQDLQLLGEKNTQEGCVSTPKCIGESRKGLTKAVVHGHNKLGSTGQRQLIHCVRVRLRYVVVPGGASAIDNDSPGIEREDEEVKKNG